MLLLQCLIGLVGRFVEENATIMNSSLGKLADKVISSFKDALKELKLKVHFN